MAKNVISFVFPISVKTHEVGPMTYSCTVFVSGTPVHTQITKGTDELLIASALLDDWIELLDPIYGVGYEHGVAEGERRAAEAL